MKVGILTLIVSLGASAIMILQNRMQFAFAFIYLSGVMFGVIMNEMYHRSINPPPSTKIRNKLLVPKDRNKRLAPKDKAP